MDPQASPLALATPDEFLPPLFRICTAMGSTLDLHDLLELILHLTLEELGAQQGSILLLEENGERLRMLASHGLPPEVAARGYMPRQGSIAEWVIQHNEPLILNDVGRDPRFTSIATGRRIRSSMCVPLRAKGRVIGTINTTRAEGDEFRAEDLRTVLILATQAAVSIDNARLYERSLAAERMATLGKTVAAISHCTKNMLTGLKGGISIVDMGRRQRNWGLVEQGLEMARRNTEHISSLIFDMLEYSKDRKPSRAPFVAAELIDEVFAGVSYAAQNARIDFRSRVDPACQTIRADAHQIYRALLNLVANAVEAIQMKPVHEGEVEIAVEEMPADAPLVSECLADRKGRFVAVRVRDTGVGIAAGDRDGIFTPFFSSKGSKGTGLGLAVTRKIAREHGGEVTFESQPGQGTTFSLLLPVPEHPEDAGGSI